MGDGAALGAGRLAYLDLDQDVALSELGQRDLDDAPVLRLLISAQWWGNASISIGWIWEAGRIHSKACPRRAGVATLVHFFVLGMAHLT